MDRNISTLAYASSQDILQDMRGIIELARDSAYQAVNVAAGSFGEAAGFRARWYEVKKGEMRFDMLVCPYYDNCTRYGCPEIVAGFCRADDVCYGSMHPRLNWGRTKTLGLGGDCCDFKLTVE